MRSELYERTSHEVTVWPLPSPTCRTWTSIFFLKAGNMAWSGRLLLCLSLVYSISMETQESWKMYKGSQVLRIQAPSVRHFESLHEMTNMSALLSGLEILKSCRVNVTTDVIVSKDLVENVNDYFRRRGFVLEVLVPDIAKNIRNELQSIRDYKRRKRKSLSASHVVGTYARYDEITQWMEELTQSHPRLVTLHSIGQTYEGRDIQVLQIGIPRMRKWKMWIDGGIHAREWISPSTVIYIADQLVRGYERGDPTVLQLLRVLDWYILPVVNPDGYEYTHTKQPGAIIKQHQDGPRAPPGER